MENIIQYKTKGAIIRSKARWYNEGEKNSIYFLNLENRHRKRKTITQIKTSNGPYATNDPDILKECNSFFCRLYASKKPTVTTCSDNLFFGHFQSCHVLWPAIRKKIPMFVMVPRRNSFESRNISEVHNCSELTMVSTFGIFPRMFEMVPAVIGTRLGRSLLISRVKFELESSSSHEPSSSQDPSFFNFSISFFFLFLLVVIFVDIMTC